MWFFLSLQKQTKDLTEVLAFSFYPIKCERQDKVGFQIACGFCISETNSSYEQKKSTLALHLTTPTRKHIQSHQEFTWRDLCLIYRASHLHCESKTRYLGVDYYEGEEHHASTLSAPSLVAWIDVAQIEHAIIHAI